VAHNIAYSRTTIIVEIVLIVFLIAGKSKDMVQQKVHQDIPQLLRKGLVGLAVVEGDVSRFEL
jgi:hypothetical protein